VLTDYHLHLRPDEEDATAAAHFTSENADRYLATAAERGIGELGCSEHVDRFTQSLALWSHPWFQRWAKDDLDEYCSFLDSTELKVGIECDYIPGAEDRTASMLEARPFDYVVGSVHFIGDLAVDAEELSVWDGTRSPEEVWARYFETVAESARAGLFDIIAHPDLVKIWGGARPVPERDPRFFYELAVEAMAEAGVAVELSTAGLRKPVGEIYPAPAFAAMCVDAGIPFALSSDAHLPEQVGYGYDQALELLDELGVSEICVFEGRERRLEPIGPGARVESS